MKTNEELLKWYEENIPNDCPDSIKDSIDFIMSSLKFIPEEYKVNIYDKINNFDYSDIFYNKFYIKEIFNAIGIWGPCWKNFCKQLSEYFSNKKVLEVGCGTGILSLGLEYYGVSIIPTTKNSNDYNINHRFNNRIEFIDAEDAIEKYKDNIDCILLSWPPYDDPLLLDTFYLSRKYNKELIYIGESEYGCNGSSFFWDILKYKGYSLEELDNICFKPFFGIYDRVYTFKKSY